MSCPELKPIEIQNKKITKNPIYNIELKLLMVLICSRLFFRPASLLPNLLLCDRAIIYSRFISSLIPESIKNTFITFPDLLTLNSIRLSLPSP